MNVQNPIKLATGLLVAFAVLQGYLGLRLPHLVELPAGEVPPEGRDFMNILSVAFLVLAIPAQYFLLFLSRSLYAKHENLGRLPSRAPIFMNPVVTLFTGVAISCGLIAMASGQLLVTGSTLSFWILWSAGLGSGLIWCFVFRATAKNEPSR